jgi:homoserine kinase type II
MAVFTEISSQEAAHFIAPLGVGQLLSMRPCLGGIENTNYFVDTDQGAYVLTVFERLTHAELPFFLRLMQTLSQQGLPVAQPQANAAGEILHTLHGKPAALVNKLQGQHVLAPKPAHCAALGAMLARLHQAAVQPDLQQAHGRGLPWWLDTAVQIKPFLSVDQQALLQAELAFQTHTAASTAYADLPRGVIHADLFRDNVLWLSSPDKAGAPLLSGMLDFYFAGVDTWLFDLAVCLNDWGSGVQGSDLQQTHACALLAAYNATRPLSPAEWALLPAAMRAAALRFWLSRLADWHLPRDASLLKPHDPAHFEQVLRARATRPWPVQPRDFAGAPLS